jgi:asparagine synthase (glutamine-hydrolysing)
MSVDSTPHVRGFLVVVCPGASRPVRAWPDPVITDGLRVCFFGYLAEPAVLRHSLRLGKDAGYPAIVGAAWRRWRGDIAERVLGEFAAVVVDGSEVAVLADRMGLRPVYWWAGHEAVVVSTDLAVLARETKASGTLDEEYLADLFGAGWHLGARTPYRNIRRLQAGEHALWRSGRLCVLGGWRPPEPDPAGTLDEHQERLRATVQRVVLGALPQGPVAVQLSGGLDSSTLLATVPRTTPVHALSFVFPGAPSSDETSWIRAALEHNPVPWHPIDATKHGHFTAGPEFDTFFAAPTHAALTWAKDDAQSAVAGAAGATAILTGQGGDAVFLGGLLPWYLADLLRTGRLKRLVAEAARWAEAADQPRPATFWLHRAGFDAWRCWRNAQALSLLPIQPLPRSAPWLEPAYIAELRLQGRDGAAGPIRGPSVHSQGIVEGIVRTAEAVRSNYAFAAGHIELRHPFLAPPLVDVALATPWRVGVDPRIDRAVQRAAFRGIVADATLRRRSKRGFDEAIFRGLERNPAWIDFLLDRPQIVSRGYAHRDRWAAAVGHATVGQVASIRHFKIAVQIEIWLRQLGRVGNAQMLTGALHHPSR